MRKLFLLSLFFAAANVQAQQKTFMDKLYDKFVSQQADSSGKPSLLVLPSGSYAPESGLSAGAQAIYSYYAGDHTITRPSMINASATYSTKRMINAKITSDIWSNGNDIHTNTEIRYRRFPLSFFGTGNATREADRDRLIEKKLLLKGYAEKKLAQNFYAGIRAGFENYAYTDEEPGGIFTAQNLDVYRYGKVLYLGVQQTIDSRNNINYTTRGDYFTTSFSYVPDFFKGNNFTGTILLADYRKFIPATESLTISLHAATQNYFSREQMPFYLMPQLGSDMLMRGYFQGRFRDWHYTAVQAEVKYRLIPRFGLVAFGGLGEVYGQTAFALNRLKPNYGAGVRYFYDLEKNISIRLDYGFGEKRPGEKRQRGFYLSLSEAF